MVFGIRRDGEEAGLLLQLVSTLFGVVMGSCAKRLGQLGVSVFMFILLSRLVLLSATVGVLCYQRINPFRSKRWVLCGRVPGSHLTHVFPAARRTLNPPAPCRPCRCAASCSWWRGGCWDLP